MEAEGPNSGASFFILLIDPRKKTLAIPQKFIQKWKQNLDKIVYLKDSDDRRWAVKVSESEGCFFFHRGWKNFVEQHSVNPGELLVFDCMGKSEFSVQIFGTSGFERLHFSHAESTEEEESVAERLRRRKRAGKREEKPSSAIALAENSCIVVIREEEEEEENTEKKRKMMTSSRAPCGSRARDKGEFSGQRTVNVKKKNPVHAKDMKLRDEELEVANGKNSRKKMLVKKSTLTTLRSRALTSKKSRCGHPRGLSKRKFEEDAMQVITQKAARPIRCSKRNMDNRN